MEMKVTRVFEEVMNAYSEGYRLIILKGGSRSGKTYALMQMFLMLLLEKKIKITVWRTEKVVCRATVMDDWLDVVNNQLDTISEFHENKAKGMFLAKQEGGRIFFEGTDNISKVLGLKQDVSFVNEVTEFNEKVFLQITQRTSGTIFVDYNPSRSFWLDKMMNRDDAKVLHFTYKDNHFCPVEIVKQLNGYNPNIKINVANGTADRYMYEVYCLGIKSEKEGKIYSGWNKMSDKHFEELPYDRVIGLDFGSIVPTGVLEIKFDGDNSMFVRQMMYTPINAMREDLAAELANCTDITFKDEIIVDPAGRAEKEKLNKKGYYCISANKKAGSVLSGINNIFGLKIHVTTSSTDIWDEYEDYTWKKDRYGISTEEPEKKDDHLMDALRYAIDYVIRNK